MQKIKLVMSLTGTIIIGLWLWYITMSGKTIEDFRILTINDEGMVLRSVSWQRKMINVLRVEGDVMIWIPRGMGWYRSDKVKKLLFQQNKRDLADDTGFYNFGFSPDVVVFGKDANWQYNGEILKKWGMINYLRYLVNNGKLMIKEEIIDDDLIKSADFLNNIMQRDLADSRLLEEDMRITVYNQGQSSGLAGFVSRILEWGGFTVVGVENSGGKSIDICMVYFGTKAEKTYGLEVIRQEFPECKYQTDKDLGETEVELYFGDKFSQMLNYGSYNI